MTQIKEKAKKITAIVVPSVLLVVALAFAMSCMSCETNKPSDSTEHWMRILLGNVFVAEVTETNDGILNTDFGTEPFEMQMLAVPNATDRIEAVFSDGISQCGTGEIVVNQNQGTLSIFGYGDFDLRFSNNGQETNPMISIRVNEAKTIYYVLKH